MSKRRWAKKRLTAAEQRARAREQALEQCEKGNHTKTPTFRPGEQICTSCGLVVYCPVCLDRQNLQVAAQRRTFPLLCETHRYVEVQV